MSHTPHELADEFPDLVDKIHALRQSDPHFERLCAEYHTVNREIHRVETRVEPTDEAHEQELRRHRMALKDQLYGMLKAS